MAEEKGKMSSHLYPADDDWKYDYPVTEEALAKIDAIKDKALALGWTMQGLYQNRGQLKPRWGRDYGLICYIDQDETIIDVTEKYIATKRPHSPVELHYYNKDVDQPWQKARKPQTE